MGNSPFQIFRFEIRFRNFKISSAVLIRVKQIEHSPSYAIMASVLLALTVAAADQENVDPSIDIIANLRSSARGVRAAHIDGSAKEMRKRSRGLRSSDAEKIESLFHRRRRDGVRAGRRRDPVSFINWQPWPCCRGPPARNNHWHASIECDTKRSRLHEGQAKCDAVSQKAHQGRQAALWRGAVATSSSRASKSKKDAAAGN